MTGDHKTVTCHRLFFVMVSRHLVMVAMLSVDLLHYVMCFPRLPVTGDHKPVTCHRLFFVMVSRHLVLLAMLSLDLLHYVMCWGTGYWQLGWAI